MRPRDPLAEFLGFDPEPFRVREEPVAVAPPPEVELQASAAAGACEARMRGAARSILEAKGLGEALKAIERTRASVIKDAQDLGLAGGWIG